MRPSTRKSTASAKTLSSGVVEAENDPRPGSSERLGRISDAAYYKAEARGFVPGMELDDWLQAEAEYEEMPQG